MKECDILTGVGTYSDPSYIVSGVRISPPPGSTPLVSHPSCRRSFVGRIACEPWSMRIVDGGSPEPTFWTLSWTTITLSPMQQKRHWLEDTVCLELIRHNDQHKQDQWSDSVQLFILDAVKVAVIQQQFWRKECDFSKHTLTPTAYFHFSVGPDPQPQDYDPAWYNRAG